MRKVPCCFPGCKKMISLPGVFCKEHASMSIEEYNEKVERINKKVGIN